MSRTSLILVLVGLAALPMAAQANIIYDVRMDQVHVISSDGTDRGCPEEGGVCAVGVGVVTFDDHAFEHAGTFAFSGNVLDLTLAISWVWSVSFSLEELDRLANNQYRSNVFYQTDGHSLTGFQWQLTHRDPCAACADGLFGPDTLVGTMNLVRFDPRVPVVEPTLTAVWSRRHGDDDQEVAEPGTLTLLGLGLAGLLLGTKRQAGAA